MATQLVTVEELKNAIPAKKNTITQEMVDLINKVQKEPEFQGESLAKTMITYQNVLKGVKGGLMEYLNAIRFCAYIVSMNDNYTEAFKRVFSDRDFVKKRTNVPPGSTEYSELSSAASRYRRSKLVVDILTASQVPLGMLFLGHQHDAVGVLYDVMMTAKLDRDKINAAKELLAAVKLPESQKIEIDMSVKENSAVQQLNDQLAAMAVRQKMLLENGVNTLDDFGALKVKEESFVDGEIVDE